MNPKIKEFYNKFSNIVSFYGLYQYKHYFCGDNPFSKQ